MRASDNEVDFIASVTHDLKSPLNAILGTIEMLKAEIASDNGSKENMLENLAIASMAGADMLEQIQNMITTARMQAGKETIHPALLSGSDLIERARNMERTFKNEARCKKVDFSVVIGKLPAFVYWDINKLRYFAINNLVSNALKFVGHTGGIVQVLIESDDANNVTIAIMDDGPGIPENERASVFGKFSQASNNQQSFHGGGLGLFNAHQITTMHHGKIEILDGLHGRGVTFKITLPAIPFEIENVELREMLELEMECVAG